VVAIVRPVVHNDPSRLLKGALPCPALAYADRSMSLLSQLERRFRRFAIPNLTTILIAGQACLWIANFLPQGINVERVMLEPSKVAQGEVWRLVTFLFTPPAVGPLIAILYFLFFHMIGTTLERHWGDFRFNVFILVGWIANVAAAFLASAMVGNADANLVWAERFAPVSASNLFLFSSLFLAFARLYPDFIINVLYVLPIRVKWLALLEWIGYAYLLLRGPGVVRLLVLATIFNYLLFFGSEHVRELRHGQRRRSFQAKAKKATASATHQCRICGLNSSDSPKTAFRYCSKCDGQACYCPVHIRDHVHVAADAAAK
jgi:hypothetical protein